MNKNNDLKERLKIELETPEVPFEEWAQKRRVFEELDECNAVTYPVTELADNVSGKGISGGNKKKIIIGSSIIAFIVAVAIILGILLPQANNQFDLPKIYGNNEAMTVEAKFEDVTSLKDVYLFDMSNVFRIELINKDILKQDNTLTLLYSLNNCLISAENDENLEAFYVTYQIRTYHNYEFYNSENYSELGKSETINNFKVDYKIVEHNDLYAYASFKDDNYEYFIEARGFTGVTVLTEDNFINLLNKILI